jgi:hypothetical protein
MIESDEVYNLFLVEINHIDQKIACCQDKDFYYGYIINYVVGRFERFFRDHEPDIKRRNRKFQDKNLKSIAYRESLIFFGIKQE